MLRSIRWRRCRRLRSQASRCVQPVSAAGANLRHAGRLRRADRVRGYKLYLAAPGAAAQGVREATIQANVPGLELNRRAIELDRAQPGGPPNSSYIPPFAPYQRRARHVRPDPARAGRYSSLYGSLAQIQARYGVDPAVLMAIYGHETSYGAVTGSFDLLEALASLAYEGRRRALFESEFVAALKLIDRACRAGG